MAAKKSHYYVLVFTHRGPAYVTGLGDHHTAFWIRTEAPKEFSSSMADDITRGLLLNGYNAAVVKMPIELTTQPYRYEIGHFEFVRDEEEEEEV